MNALAEKLPPTTTRVERATAPALNESIRARTDARVEGMEGLGGEDIASRLRELDREWDVERVLQANASTLVLLGVVLGVAADRRFLLLPAAVLTFLAQHALQGWCPPIPILRRLGVRTMREVQRERHALKALRGDYDAVPSRGAATGPERVRAALAAVDA